MNCKSITENFGLSLPVSTLEMFLHLQAYVVYDKRSSIIHIFVPLYNVFLCPQEFLVAFCFQQFL